MDSFLPSSVLLTHPRAAQGDVLIESLQEADIALLHLPLLSMDACDDSVVCKQVSAIRADDILVFTSKNGVKYFSDCCKRLQLSFVANEIYALGAKTAEAAKSAGYFLSFVGSGESSKTFAEEIIKRDDHQSTAKRYVLLRGERASDELPGLLVSHGFNTEKITIYQTLKLDLDADDRGKLKSWLLSIAPSKLVVFTSSLAAEVFCKQLQQLSMISALATIDVAVLGVTTQKFVANLGFRNVFMPEQATVQELSSLLIHLVKKG